MLPTFSTPTQQCQNQDQREDQIWGWGEEHTQVDSDIGII